MTSTKNKDSSMKSSSKNNPQSRTNWYLTVFIVVAVVTAATRFYKVSEPDHVW